MLYLAIGPEMTGSSCYPNGLDQATSSKHQAASTKRQAKKDLTGSCIHDNVGLINQQKGHNEILYFIKI